MHVNWNSTIQITITQLLHKILYVGSLDAAVLQSVFKVQVVEVGLFFFSVPTIPIPNHDYINICFIFVVLLLYLATSQFIETCIENKRTQRLSSRWKCL